MKLTQRIIEPMLCAMKKAMVYVLVFLNLFAGLSIAADIHPSSDDTQVYQVASSQADDSAVDHDIDTHLHCVHAGGHLAGIIPSAAFSLPQVHNQPYTREGDSPRSYIYPPLLRPPII